MAHSNHFLVNSGYGTEIWLILCMLAELGYEVGLSAFYGQQGFYDERELYPGGPVIPVYPAGQHPYGGDSVGMHARHFGADLVISLMDQWAMSHETLDGIPYAAISPVDTDNEDNPKCALGLHDANSLAQWRQTVPVAMSLHGQRVLTRWQDEFNQVNPPKLHRHTPVPYLPHAISGVFQPPADRDLIREQMSIGGLFAVGMVAANRDKSRKQFPIQEAAFMKFHRRHPDSVLIMHTEESNPHGLELRRMAERIGLVPGSYRFSAQYLLAAGMVPPAQVSGTMGACDVGLQATAAEGFGLPIGEFLASGTPVIGTDHPVHAQVIGPGGWLAEAEDLWATGHEAWWRAARVSSLVKLLDLAYHGARPGAEQGRGCADPAKAARAYALRKAAARQHVADNFSYDLVRDRHLRPVLAQLGEHFGMD